MNTLDLKAGPQSHTPLIYGHFLSNNLVLYLKKDGILVSNVNEPLQYIHSLNLSKFQYIDFFNGEAEFKFKFDSKLVQRSILKSWINNIEPGSEMDLQTESGFYVVL